MLRHHNVRFQSNKSKPKQLLRRPRSASKERLLLLDDIENALTPSLKSQRKPEASISELFVISLLFQPDASLGAALRWILGNIPYYRNRALDDFTSQNMGPHQPRKITEQFYSQWENLPDDFHLPIAPSKAKGVPHVGKAYNAITTESRFFLEDILHRTDDSEKQDSSDLLDLSMRIPRDGEQERSCPRDQKHLLQAPVDEKHKKAFPFNLLPAELRDKVYQLVLAFPKSGIRLGQDHAWRTEPMVYMAKREMDDPDKSLWREMIEDNGDDWALQGHMLSHYLSIFRVSRQMYAESMPVFYAINHFACTSMKDLWDLLRHSPEVRRKHIRSITFPLIPPRQLRGSMGEMTKACKLLKRMPGLRNLEIVISEDDFKAATDRRGRHKFPDVLNIEPIKVLRTMRGLQRVEFLGDCDNVREFLGPEMTKPAPAKVVMEKRKRVAVKRKAGDVEGVEGQKKPPESRGKKDGKKVKISCA